MDNLDFSGDGLVFGIGAAVGIVAATALATSRPVRQGLVVAFAAFLAMVAADQGLAGLIVLGRHVVGQALDNRTLALGMLAGSVAASAFRRHAGAFHR